MERTRKPQTQAKVPTIIHWINLGGVVALGLIFLLAAVVRPYQLIILVLAVFFLGIFYWRFRSSANVAALSFAIPLAVACWIVLCENVVTADNLLGTEITRNLKLGTRLLSYVAANTATRAQILEGCCNDSLSYHYKPGSTFRRTYDCPTCYQPYEVTVDETGYLNREIGFYENNDRIDSFLAGDSVMQGWGMPSVLDSVRVQIPLKMWNLSIGGYGPRERVNALIAYALPKHPKWLLIDFYSANDPAEAIELEACEAHQDFHCRFSIPDMRRRLSNDPTYGPMLTASGHAFSMFDYYAENSLTLAVTRYLLDEMKSAIKRTMKGRTVKPSALALSENGLYDSKDVSHPGDVRVPIRSDRLSDWVQSGMLVTHKHYQRLGDKLSKLDNKPAVILIYNPSAYEIYRGIFVGTDPKYDAMASFQLLAQRSFAEKNGWIFLDLTIPLRNKLAASKKWIYGRYDAIHWSPEGTSMVADVLAEELNKLLTN